MPILALSRTMDLCMNYGTCTHILSSDILFTSKRGSGPDKKQAQNERLLKLPPFRGNAVGPIRLIEHTSFDLDKVRGSLIRHVTSFHIDLLVCARKYGTVAWVYHTGSSRLWRSQAAMHLLFYVESGVERM